MVRAPCCDKNGLKKGPWMPEEDQKLTDYIQKHGHGNWRTLPKNAGLERCGKSCRLRWTNYLRPDIKRGRFSFEEEEAIIQLHSFMGNKWSSIAARLPGRTDNEIKNYWNTHIRKRLLRMGIDPVTHRPRLDLLDLSSLLGQSLHRPNQFDVSRSLVGSKLLSLATTLLSLQSQNSNQLLNQGLEEPQIENPLSSFQAQQLQNPIDQEIQGCTTPNAQLLDEAQIMQASNVGQFQPDAQINPWPDVRGVQSNFSANFTPSTDFSNGNLDQSISHYFSENSNFDALNGENYSLTCALSTPPVSSPTHLNSSSTCVNSCTEEERDSYCSEFLKYQTPDLFDVDYFT